MNKGLSNGKGVEMRVVRAVGLVAIGVAIGAAGAGYWSPVRAQVFNRFSMVDGNNVASSGVLIVKDARSTGCWLMAQSHPGGVALAPAPAEACK
jgi:hypothetical protein